MPVVRGTRREVHYDVALTPGPRQGELRGLLWSDISGSTLTIVRSISTDYDIAWGPTKTGEERTLRLPRRHMDAFRRHRKAQLEERAAASIWREQLLAFPNTHRDIWRHQGMHVAFERDLVADRGSASPSAARLGHTAAPLMLKKRVPVNVASRVLGHSDPAMTLRRYTHALSDMQEMAADAMEESSHDVVDFA